MSAPGTGSENIEVTIRVSRGPVFNVVIDQNWTVADLKINCEKQSEITPQQQRLIYKGRILKDDEKLLNHCIVSGSTIHLVQSAAAAQNPSPNTTGSTSQANTTNDGICGDYSCRTEPNFSSGAAPNLGAVPGDRQAMPNLESMMGMMQSPAFQQLMQNTFSAMNFNQNPMSGPSSFTNQTNSTSPPTPNISQTGLNNGNQMGTRNFNPDILMQILQSPTMQQTIQSLSQDPQMLNTVLQGNPRLNQLLNSMPINDQSGPNSEMIRNLMTGMQSNSDFPPINNNLNMNFIQDALQMFSGSQINPAHNGMTNNTEQLQTRFSSQLDMMAEMGFIDRQAALEALQQSGGDVNAAIGILLDRGFGN